MYVYFVQVFDKVDYREHNTFPLLIILILFRYDRSYIIFSYIQKEYSEQKIKRYLLQNILFKPT